MDYRNESAADVPCQLQLCLLIISCSCKIRMVYLMTTKRRENMLVLSFESVALLRLEFGIFLMRS